MQHRGINYALPYWVERASSSSFPASATNSCQKFLSAAAMVLCPDRYLRTRQESAVIDFPGIFPREKKKTAESSFPPPPRLYRLAAYQRRRHHRHDDDVISIIKVSIFVL